MDWNAFIVPLTLIFTELFKRTIRPESKLLPWIAVFLGGVFGAIFGIVMIEDTQTMFMHVVQGVIYGAAAAGVYDVGASMDGRDW